MGEGIQFSYSMHVKRGLKTPPEMNYLQNECHAMELALILGKVASSCSC